MNRIKALMNNEGISYLFWGVCSTVVNWIVYTGTISLSPLSMTMCNFLAWIAAVLFAYVTNKLFVFRSHTSGIAALFREFLLFIGARVFTGVFEVTLPSLLYHIGVTGSFLGIRGFWAKALVSVLVIVLNYIFSKLLIFRHPKK